ncbi:hypothetical protein POP15_097 [Pectobacterium phage POP15]|nr:hypothetical protein POP15_097 [Pectobacterium phage POP15]
MIKDCFGVPAIVGDHIAFSQGNAGAKTWEHAIITKISEKTVTFQGKAGGMFRDWHGKTELRRPAGAFVIDVSKREADALNKLVALSEKDRQEGRVYSRDQLMESLNVEH